MDIDQYGSANIFNWSHQHLTDILTRGNKRIIQDPLIANAFKAIKREDFIREPNQSKAYQDQQLEILNNQFMTQPTTVAQILQLLHPRESKKYLDIGAGSGYVAALLGFITGEQGKVYTLERNQYIAEFARQNILKYPNLAGIVQVVFKDGQEGYAEKAPFDFIHSSVAFTTVPSIIKNQLVVGGRMTVPTTNNDLRLIERVSPTDFDERIYEGFIFTEAQDGIE